MDINSEIKKLIKENDVCLFMKGSAETPQCGFSMTVTNILKYLNVLENDKMREGIKIFSDWPTIPQLYVKGEFVGGCDIVKEMFEKGELKELFQSKKII